MMIGPQSQIESRVGETLARTKKARETHTDLVVALYEHVLLQDKLNRAQLRFKDASTPDQREALRLEIEELWERFRASNGDGHSNPDWILRVMRGCIATTLDESKEAHEKALELALESLPYARTYWQRGISLANASEDLRCLDRASEAIEYALNAVVADPRNDGFLAYLALALMQEGSPQSQQAAAQLFRSVPDMTDLTSPESVWRGYLLAYTEFLTARDNYPDLDKLYRLMEKK